MGGQGSGRPPSEETIIKRTMPVLTPIGTDLFLPNYSGLKSTARKDNVGESISHTTLSDIGTNTHAQIDFHIADSSDPHGATLTQTSLQITSYLMIVADYPQCGIYYYNPSLFGGGYNVFKRGTTGDADAAVASSSELGYNSFYGWDGTDYKRGGYFAFYSTENWDATHQGTLFNISTTLNGQDFNSERLVIDGDGIIIPKGNINSDYLIRGGYYSLDFSEGITATITTAKLTSGGANGSMTFKNGILTAQTAAT
jgi:hypothetical protein